MDKEIAKFVQPQVVAVGDLHDMDNLYTVCEGKILCLISQQRIVDSIVALLASFYIFNIDYKEGKAIMPFLEQALLGVGSGQTMVSVSSFFNAISKTQI